MSIESLIHTSEFEGRLPVETERKFIAIFPEKLTELREEAEPIEQFYLSHPDEPFSLRLRSTLNRDTGELQYEATLKDNGIQSNDGLRQLEVTTEISPELYEYYCSGETPIIRKLRAEPLPGVVIDFFENDGLVQAELEDDGSLQEFIDQFGNTFMEVTGGATATGEWQAHYNFRREHEGREALSVQPELDINDIVSDILTSTVDSPHVIHIAGRSGSGKSTIVRQLRERLDELNINSITMSTDDYHRGATYLYYYNNRQEWQHWDDPFVYDTETMAIDLQNLINDKEIYHRHMNWQTAEPYIAGTLSPAEVIIIEGIYAKSPDIITDNSLVYEIPTPIATCIGRRILRDLNERPQFCDPSENLLYLLSEAEPAYRAQQQPTNA
ncbi:hypothetical protein FBF28_03645 [Candidatus Saccharibacteria bacterium oral taxon 488]|nr:hypothetical protein FBF28_03645 [Candidatus Saccharibacteria bacterium oral taxon 488]